MKKAKTVPKSKVCTKCGTDKPIDDFRTHKSGYNLNQCRQCERDMAKKRREDKRGKTATPTKKVCTICGKVKPIDNFRTHKSGYNLNQCRQCEKDMAKKRIEDKHSKTVTATTTKKGKLIPFSIFCNKCGKDKPIADFRTNKSGVFPNQCRQCEKEMAKKSIEGKRG